MGKASRAKAERPAETGTAEAVQVGILDARDLEQYRAVVGLFQQTAKALEQANMAQTEAQSAHLKSVGGVESFSAMATKRYKLLAGDTIAEDGTITRTKG